MKTIYQTLSSLTFILLFISSVTTANAQSFTNGDLAGTVGTSNNPTGWTNVLLTDAICTATHSFGVTPDIADDEYYCDGTGCTTFRAYPYTGTTFVSAVSLSVSGGAVIFDEGIQQTVSGFNIGDQYTITFYQAVIKQSNCWDDTGAWRVYIGSTLIGTTASTSCAAGYTYSDRNVIWEQRTITFSATGTSQTFKFMPHDDDGNSNSNEANGAVRMGIDDISVAMVLPVELTTFITECNANTVELNWTTASETNNDYFTIERSTDAVNFETVGTANGNGNSSVINNYSWTDDNPISGTAYYRLKQTDFNGAFEYHVVRALSCEPTTEMSIYPNPFENGFTVQLSENTTYPLTIEVLDYLGRKVYSQTIETNLTEITLNDQLSTGTYFVKVITQTSQVVERIVKMK